MENFQNTEYLILGDQGDAKVGNKFFIHYGVGENGIVFHFGQVGDMNDLAFLGGPPGQATPDFQAGILQGVCLKALPGGIIVLVKSLLCLKWMFVL